MRIVRRVVVDHARHDTMIAAVLCVVLLFSGRLASSEKSFSYGGQAGGGHLAQTGWASVSVDSQSGFSQQFTVPAAEILPKPPLLTGPQTAFADQSSGHRAAGQQNWEVSPQFPPPPRPAKKKASTKKKPASTTPASAGQTAPANKKPTTAAASTNKKRAGRHVSSSASAAASSLNSQQAAYGLDAVQTAPAANKKPAAASTKKQAVGHAVGSVSASATATAASSLSSQQAAYGLGAGQTAPAANKKPAAGAASTKKQAVGHAAGSASASATATAASSLSSQQAAYGLRAGQTAPVANKKPAAAAASTKKQAVGHAARSASASATVTAASSLSSQQAGYGLNPAGEPEYGLNQKAIDDILREHNVIRARERVPPLTWNATLAKFSQEYMETKRKGDCQMLHSSSPYGENMMQGKGDGLTWKTTVDEWSDEKKSYHYGSNSCDPGKECGHYTAVVWKGTTSVGCGRVKCNNGDAMLMCSYWPAGNDGAKPF